MGRQDEIRKALEDFCKKYGPAPTLLATVVSVDEDEKTCVLDDDGLEVPQVRLRPVIDEVEGLTLFPKSGTWCLAVRVEDDEDWMALAFGEVDKWRLKIGEAVIEQTADGLLIQNDNDTLKEVLNLIIDAVLKIKVLQGTNADVAKLNQAKTKTNNIFR